MNPGLADSGAAHGFSPNQVAHLQVLPHSLQCAHLCVQGVPFLPVTSSGHSGDGFQGPPTALPLSASAPLPAPEGRFSPRIPAPQLSRSSVPVWWPPHIIQLPSGQLLLTTVAL